jgi:arabinogalactan oligomer / maltooligosaccharide transport system substrate-binding protein
MKKILAPILAVILALSFGLAGCNQVSPQGTQTPVSSATASLSSQTTEIPSPSATSVLPRGTITLWHSWDESQVSALVSIIAAFRKQYPDIQFDVLYVPAEVLRDRMETATRDGTGPTLLIGPAEWGPVLFDGGAIADLSPLAGRAFLDTINAPALGTGRYKNALISLPYSMQGVVLYRNLNIMPQGANTFQDLVNLAQSSRQGDIQGAILERGFLYSGAHLLGLGGQLMDENGDPAFNNAKGLAWIDLLRAFQQAGPVTFNDDQDLDFFRQSKAGIIIDGTWNRVTISDTLGMENVAVDPWPAYADGHLSGFVQANSLFLSAFATGDQRLAGWEFIKYFLSAQAQQTLPVIGQIPVLKNVPVDDPIISQAMKAMEGGTTYPVRPEMAAYTAPMDGAIKAIFSDGVAPPDALQSASDAVRSALNALRNNTNP